MISGVRLLPVKYGVTTLGGPDWEQKVSRPKHFPTVVGVLFL